MGYGLRVKNDSLEIQIDGVYRNFAYSSQDLSETIDNNADAAGDWFEKKAFTSTSLEPIVIVQPNTDHFICVDALSMSGSSYVGVYFVTEYGESTTIAYRIYKAIPTIVGAGYGIRIYDAAGYPVFDSGHRYLKIVSISAINLANPTYASNPYTNISHAAISNPYYFLTQRGWYVNSTSVPSVMNHFKKIGIKKLTSTSVRVGWFNFYQIVTAMAMTQEGYNPSMKLVVCENT